MTIDHKTTFLLEGWLVEPEFNQLTSGEVCHRVEPKVMSVLLYLAACAPRVASKDEILRAVWPDTFVGEDALTRCISVLRHILDDAPRDPRFIKTVPKVGYCLLVEARPYLPTALGAVAPANLLLDHTEQPVEIAPSSLPGGRKASVRVAGALLLLLAALGSASFFVYRAT
jgi:DNA-binding winged helix-turn-helix (wHTH) protein